MNIYKYYLNDRTYNDAILSQVPEKDALAIKYKLYAATNDKELAKEFEKTRNMKKFIKKVKKDVTMDDYRKFASINRGSILSRRELVTKHPGCKPYWGDIKFVITEEENLTVNMEPEDLINMYMEDILSKLPDADSYKKKLKIILKKTYYLEAWEFFSSDLPFTDEKYTPNWLIDELRVFVTLYGSTLKY